MNDLDLGRATESRELRDNELDAASGGVVIAIIAILIGLQASYKPAR